ncbi:mechanosensitive ion channel family protein [Flavobacterium urocaniciphilum]|uniref:Miniconductance mechanosensitive channel n=1 Tax=Flavobacterium urocaniciphilum TaxID=1299341 RepID=A0A1H8ZGE1_9FLAO|nr:mechanosensitive ion channel domain-containing protein [Flavobacterium urocaniciphilum]SEP62778.1 miniconductance mechanosensitive channel [Flavobacterium urocaniciphilum]
MKVFDLVEPLLKKLDLGQNFVLYGNLLVNLIVLAIIAYAIDYLAKKVLIIGLAIVATYTKSTFDDFLVANKTAKYIAHLVPLYYISKKIPIVLDDFVYWENLFGKSVKIFIIVLSLFIVRSIFNSLKDYLKTQPKYNDKPIDSYIQVIMIVLWIYALVSIILLLFDTKKGVLLTTFGSISALIILVFRDTILGFVASIQVTVNDMVRIGDWITVDKFGADGEVEEINLATVKVRNFDNTTSTIPTYSLISDSFRNWRGMINSDGRRIKRHILIKGATVRFINNDELESFKRIQNIASYIDRRKADIDKYNIANNIDKSLNVNGRNLTNLGLFRKYIQRYIESHPGINKDMQFMVRHLQPTEKGIPLEIYCFSKDKKWENYEYIMADIFDHVIASIPYFDLELFEVQHVKADKLNLLDIE